MKVLLITTDFLPRTGGVSVFNQGIAESMSLAGNRVWVLAPDSPGREDEKLSYKVIRYKTTKHLSNLWPSLITLYLSLTNKIDLILLGHAASTLSAGGVLARKLKLTRLAVLIHGYDLVYAVSCPLDKYCLGSLIRNADLVLANSGFTKDNILKTYKCAAVKVKILNPGIWPEEFHKSTTKSNINAKEEISILTVCRLVSGKGLEVLLDAFTIVKGKIPKAILEIVGQGPLLSALRDKAVEQNIQDNVLFLGKVSKEKLVISYNGCDVFVMPSEADDKGRYEGFGIVYLEANACGKPVIGTRHGGVPEAVEDGVTGILVDPGNAQQLADAMLLLLGNKELRNKMGQAGKQRVEDEFNWIKVAKRLETYISAIK